MKNFYLSSEEMANVAEKMEQLSANGVTVSEEHSGEMNFSGCASGSCMAWA